MKRFLLALLFCLLPVAGHAASCGSYPFTLQNNTTADATQVMANFNTVRNCVINNAAGSGVNTDITSITGLSTPLSVPQGGTPVFIGGTSTVAANAQVVAATNPIGFSLTTGYRITFTAGFTNTAATTLDVNSTGATAVRRVGHAGLEALTGGEIVTGNIIEAIYNGTFFVLLNSDLTGVGTRTDISAGTTVDLGTISTHNANITGSGVSIASFGSSAVATDPVYMINFAAANTLVYNVTSMKIPGLGNITTAAGDTGTVEYLGSGNWQVLNYTRANGGGLVQVTPLCGARGFTATNNAGTPNTNYDIAAAAVVMVNSTGVPITANSVSVTVNATTTGANGLDAGSLSTSKWYYGYLINNGTTTAGLLSLSATSPTLPSGYTYTCRLSAISTDGSSNFYRMYQVGSRNTWNITVSTNTTLPPIVASGSTGTFSATTPTLAAKTVRGDGFCAPSTATAVSVNAIFNLAGGTGSDVIVAPTTGWGFTNSGPQGSVGVIWPIYINNSGAGGAHAWLDLSGNSIGVAMNAAGGGVACMAYKDNVNAN